MSNLKRNKCFIYKNDLKFNESIDLETSEFESDAVKSIYNNFKNKPKIELRIEDSIMENYKYLDLSKLEINDKYLEQLFSLEKIINILKQIEFLDLSNNNLTTMPNLDKYPNIIYFSISFNDITSHIENHNFVELSCQYNKITSIKSKSIKQLNASNNKISNIDVPNIVTLIISSNKLSHIDSYLNIKYLECIDNKINKIDNMISLEELYIGNNEINSIKNMPKLQVLNCVGNPIDKIRYFPRLKILMVSNPTVSNQYSINNISKIKSDYLINFKI